MKHLRQKVDALPWAELTENLQQKGFAHVSQLLDQAECQTLLNGYHENRRYRKTVNMERYRFGQGEYKYFTYPLPPIVQTLRENLYPHLAAVANTWMQTLEIDTEFPHTREALSQRCAEYGQHLATPLILRYTQGGYNTLHQDLYGEVYFPLQAVLFLNEPEEEYTGGEFVLMQQNPRAQSQALVLRPKRGDAVIFATQFRPVKGSKGYYRAQMKHGVSEVYSGERHTLGIIFHDALS